MNLADTIAILLRSGPRTAGDLAAATGTRPASVRAVLNGMQQHREVEPGAVICTGRRGRPGRGWRLLREVLELPFPAVAAQAPCEQRTIQELVEADSRLNDSERCALLALVERARTPAELRQSLKLGRTLAARQLLARLERRGLVQLVDHRQPPRVDERLWELTPQFLAFF